MTFLHPILASVGLACVALPILIHILMRRRRRPIAWAAMRYLREALRRQRRRLALEQWLLLASRCLLVALAALAIGGLALGASGHAREPSVLLIIIIDDSIASGARAADGRTDLDHRIDEAKALAQRLSPARGDRVGLIASGRPARAILLPPTGDIGALDAALDTLRPTSSRADLSGAVALGDAVEPRDGEQRTLAMLSGWWAGVAPDEGGLPRLTHPARILASPPAPGLANLSLASIEPARLTLVTPGLEGAPGPGATEDVRVNVRRGAEGAQDAIAARLRLSLERSGGARPLGEFALRLSAGATEGSIPIQAPLSSAGSGGGVLRGEIIDDALPGDNVARRAIDLRASIRVGLVAHPRAGAGLRLEEFLPGDWLALALAPEPDAAGEREIDLSWIDPGAVDAPRLAGLDAVAIVEPDLVLAQAWTKLADFCRAGGLVVIFPSRALGAQTWIDPWRDAFGLDWVRGREPAELDEPVTTPAGPGLLELIAGEVREVGRSARVQRLLELAPGEGRRIELAAGEGRAAVVSGLIPGAARGLVVLAGFSPDLEWTNLPAKPLMLPLMQELVRQGVGQARGAWRPLAGSRVPAPPGSRELLPLAGAGASLAIEADGLSAEPVLFAGAWRAVDARGATTGLVTVEPDIAGARLDAETPERVREWLAPLGTEASFMNDAEGSPVVSRGRARVLGPVLLGLAALAALGETALAARSGRSGAAGSGA